MNNKPVSIVILTFNRPVLLEKQLQYLDQLNYSPLEVIVVDNHSDAPVSEIVAKYSRARLIQMEQNLGVAGRNRGISAANSDIVITLDDDVSGITDMDIQRIVEIFTDKTIGAVCFKVLDEYTGEVINWCHHRKMEEYADSTFITDEITEGAVAFRKDAVLAAGLYPEYFFISHEGPDLALRLMNGGNKVIYTPDISVHHSHSTIGRPGWRRYYYDTRNLIWLVLRNYPLLSGTKKLAIGLVAMGLYSLRDGYLLYWFKGIVDGLKESGKVIKERSPFTAYTRSLLDDIDKYRPSMWYMIKKRLFRKKVRI